MNKKLLFAYLSALVVYAVFFLPYDIGPPYNPQVEIGARVYIALGSYIASLVIFTILVYYVWKAVRFAGPEKREPIEMLFFFYLFMDLAVISLTIGIVPLVWAEESYTLVRIGFLRFFVYPTSLCLGSLFGATSALFLFMFGVKDYLGESGTLESAYSALYVIGTILIVLPQNYYGAVAPGRVSPVRVASQLVLLLLYMIAMFVVVVGVIRRIGSVKDALLRVRLKVALSGFVMLMGFFAFYLVDALTGIPYSIWIIPAYAFGIMSLVLFYLGFITPAWFERLLIRRLRRV